MMVPETLVCEMEGDIPLGRDHVRNPVQCGKHTGTKEGAYKLKKSTLIRF